MCNIYGKWDECFIELVNLILSSVTWANAEGGGGGGGQGIRTPSPEKSQLYMVS